MACLHCGILGRTLVNTRRRRAARTAGGTSTIVSLLSDWRNGPASHFLLAAFSAGKIPREREKVLTEVVAGSTKADIIGVSSNGVVVVVNSEKAS